MTQPEVLSQEFELGFTYTRSTGPVVGRFLTELRDKNVVGIKGSDGKVYVPPMEYDPVTAEELSEFVEVGQAGEVVSWCWVNEPRESHPHEQPLPGRWSSWMALIYRWCTAFASPVSQT